ncbi:unnamed protein product [Lactuca saligna]|uniref:Uncharacterized protein n=1 Tax=Lactuca saligna TaxID=75948 RepID=A0AA35ZTA5_LACSI|nr:unnamed protein product [Lactuca saligna]
MVACVSTTSTVLQQYRKLPSSGPRELTQSMVRSIEEADKPIKQGKSTETQKETKVTKPTKGQTPKKRKSDKAALSQPQPKKLKKPTRRLILQSSTDSESEYVPPKHKSVPPSESKSKSSDDEASSRGAHSKAPTPPVTTEPPLTTEPPVTTKPLSLTPSTDTIVLGIEDLEFDSTYFNPYRVQSDEDGDEPVTKRHLNAVNDKLDQLLSSSSSGIYSDAALKALWQLRKISQTVNASVDNLQRSLQAERSKLEYACQAIEAANATLHDKVNEASVSKRDKKKKKIGEDDTDNEEDVYEKNPENPFQKTKSSVKELEEKFKQYTDELLQKQKEKELLEKKMSIFPEWILDSLQMCAIDEPSILWLEL